MVVLLFSAFLVIFIPLGPLAKPISGLSLLGIPISFHDLLFAIVMFRALFSFLSKKKRPIFNKIGSCLTLLKGFLIVALMALLVGLWNRNDLWDIGRDMLNMLYFLIAFAAISLMHSREDVLRLLRAICFAAVSFAGLMIISYLLGEEFFVTKPVVEYFGFRRMYFINCFTYVPAFLYFFIMLRSKRGSFSLNRALSLLALVVLVIAAILSYGRMLQFTMVLSILISVFLYNIAPRETSGMDASPSNTGNKGSEGVMLFGVILFMVVFIIALLFVFVTPINFRALGDSYQAWKDIVITQSHVILSDWDSGRLLSYRLAWEELNNIRTLLLGDGLGRLFLIPWSDFRGARIGGYQPGVDNTALTLLGKMGILGVIIFYWLLGRMLRTALILASRASTYELKLVGLVLGPTLISWTMLTLTTASLVISEFVIVFGLIIAAIEFARRIYEDERERAYSAAAKPS
jgi:uncharacterized membrane protein YbjE (DUF340 family)